MLGQAGQVFVHARRGPARFLSTSRCHWDGPTPSGYRRDVAEVPAAVLARYNRRPDEVTAAPEPADEFLRLAWPGVRDR
jgi:hypothetical protein